MKHFVFVLSFLSLLTSFRAQVLAPITTTNYNLDAVAENTTALATTGGALDASDYVMYSEAYGAIYSVNNGLPNSGIIASGTRTYQLQNYTANNVQYLLPGQTDSIIFVSPAGYSGISMLGFGTEGSASIVATIRYTDNTTEVFSNLTFVDWFGTGTAIISGFDRVNRNGTTPAMVSGNPKMFYIDLIISCPNRSKNIQNVKIQNVGLSGRSCVMAISGAAMPTFSVSSFPVTCAGGTDGSVMVTPSGGIGPYTYTWSTQPANYSGSVGNLPVGTFSVWAADIGACSVMHTVAITQSLAVQPSLNVVSATPTVCAGTNVTIGVAGASSFTWSTGSNSTAIVVNPAATTIYTVGGHTNLNCYRTGSISIVVNPKPVVTFNPPASTCFDSPMINLSATPGGGFFSGPGVITGNFHPNVAGVGTKTVSYTFSDSNNCTTISVSTIVVNALPVLGFTISPTPLCANSAAINLTATPAGGTFAGTGVSGSAYTASVAGVGTQTISYTYTDANNCTNMIVSSVLINEVPTTTITTSKKNYCVFSPSIFLNANPSGGVYAGPGITGSAFNPSQAGVGNHQITYSYTDANNCTGSAAINMTVSACTGIEERALNKANISVYPNPSSGVVTITSEEDGTFVILSELGQTVATFSLNLGNQHTMVLDRLAPGIYFVMEQGSSFKTAEKIVIAN